MSGDWRRFCRTSEFSVEDDAVRVFFSNSRGHLVRVEEREEDYLLSAAVASARLLESVEQPAVFAWTRNRSTQLVGFRVDARGRMVGEAFVPRAGLQVEEFRLSLRAVASECDRLEHLLTGADNE